MRPDQHKQKKNAQYKKKHGISNKDRADQDSSKDKGRGKNKRQPATVLRESEKQDTNSSRTNPLPNEEKGPGEQALGPIVVVPENNFRRREVVSNWSRYEGLDEATRELEKHKGADFRTVLSVTSDAMSKFRLQSEKEWDTDIGQRDPEDSMGCLAVNVPDLAGAVQCVPLHKRLGLSEEFFGGELLENFKREAHNKLKTYQSDPKRKHTADTSVFEQTLVLSDDSRNESSAILPAESIKADDIDVNSDEGCDVLEEILNLNTENNRTNHKKEKSTDWHKSNEYIGTVTNEQGERSEQKQKHENTHTCNRAVLKCDMPNVKKEEEELDFLLSLDTPVKHSESENNCVETESSDEIETNECCKNNEEKMAERKESNLDDWLDSMLDDD